MSQADPARGQDLRGRRRATGSRPSAAGPLDRRTSSRSSGCSPMPACGRSRRRASSRHRPFPRWPMPTTSCSDSTAARAFATRRSSPTQRGMERAIAASVDAICVFTAATESYVRHNIGMSIDESLEAFALDRLAEPCSRALDARLREHRLRLPVRGRGAGACRRLDQRAAARDGGRRAGDQRYGGRRRAERRAAGCSARWPRRASRPTPSASTSTTRAGPALANVITAMGMGYACFDAAAGGIGGSPFAPGSAGQPRHRGPRLPARPRGGPAWRRARRRPRRRPVHRSSGSAKGPREQGRARRGLARLRTMSPMDGAERVTRRHRRAAARSSSTSTPASTTWSPSSSPRPPRSCNLRGVTCVAGNVELQHVARNTGKILRLVGRGDVPVSIGAARPLVAAAAHRLRDARPDRHRLRRDARRGPRPRDDRLHRRSRPPATSPPTSSGIPGTVTVGRARAADEPRARRSPMAWTWRSGLREVVWMGGTLEDRGNTTETGEWNACVDPEAAEMCLRAGAIGRIFPLDATQDVIFTMDDLRAPCPTRTWRGSCGTRSASTWASIGRSTRSMAAISTTR